MSKYTIVLLPGDGIGKIVMQQAIRVLDAVGFDAEYVTGDIGWEFWCNEGNPLPDRTVRLIGEHKIALFGAITSKPKDDAAAELKPELRDKGYVYASPIVGLRQKFNLDICIRPCKSYKGNPLNFVKRRSDGSCLNLISMPLFSDKIPNACIPGLNGPIPLNRFTRLFACILNSGKISEVY